MGWNIELPNADWYAPGDERLDGLIREVLDQDVVAIDTETTGIVKWKDMPLFWSMAWGENRRVCMPISTAQYFTECFADPTKRWVFANAKFDMHMMANVGLHFAGECIDVAVMHALLYEEESHALKDMAKHILGWRWEDFFDTFKPLSLTDTAKPPRILKNGTASFYKRKETIQEMLLRCERENLDKLVEYASNDAYGTLRLYDTLKQELEKTYIESLYPDKYETMAHLYFLIEAPFTKVLWKCERNGVHVNREYMQSRRQPMVEEIHSIERRCVAITGNPQFNPNSTDQLREYFIKQCGLKPLMWTKGGKSGVKQPSVDKNFLEKYADENELAEILLRHRKLTKILGTYIDGLSEHLDPWERIHTKFNQDVARTGRLSSSEPNLQNIPRPDEDVFKLRGGFQATADHDLIVGDYEQLEMRLLASAAREPSMVQIFLDGKDIHMGNAALVFGPIYARKYGWHMTYEDIVAAKKIDGKVKKGELPTEALDERCQLALFARQAAKAIGFGLNYGMKEGKLSRSLKCSKEEALDLMNAYLDTYPAVKQFFHEAVEGARETGYSFTLMGRRRFHPEIISGNNLERWEAERKATNNEIQGTAADAVRLAMVLIDKEGLDKQYGCHMLLQVHDELMFECPKDYSEKCRARIKEIMEHPFPTDLDVPLDVSIGIGPAWDKAK